MKCKFWEKSKNLIRVFLSEKTKKTDDGFSFAETVAVLAIMLILTASVGISAFKYVDKAKTVSAKNQILTYKIALNAYYLDCGMYPTKEQGLNALWEKPILYPVPKNWNGPYLDSQIKLDPWGNEYQYTNNAGMENMVPFEILSFGSDGDLGGKGSEEDLVSWKL